MQPTAGIPKVELVRIENGQWRCTWCGASIAGAPIDKSLHIELRSASGEQTFRVVEIEGTEVHRCPSPPQRTY